MKAVTESHAVSAARPRSPEAEQFLADVLRGLRRPAKELPCKYFYDEAGSRLFEQICELDEYYLTRTELAIMREHADEMAALLGPGCLLVEYGSGSGVKTRLLLDRLERPAAYVPVDVSRESLVRSARQLALRYPGLEVLPVCADFTGDFELPTPGRPAARRVVYFPGSTIGNFSPRAARRLLRGMARLVGPGGAALVGVDLKKDPRVLERAYDDAAGVTAAFNRNVLHVINRALGADFRPEALRHHAFYNASEARIEMHLVSERRQTVRIPSIGLRIELEPAETIWTESSYKFTRASATGMLAEAGLRLEAWHSDRERRFALALAAPRAQAAAARRAA